MGGNVPDDWGNYYTTCRYCGRRYHESEGGCPCLDDHAQCEGCKGQRFFRGSGNPAAEEGWHHLDDLYGLGDLYYCDYHYVCSCCEEGEPTLEASTELGEPCCERCKDEDHWCPMAGPLLDYIAKTTEPEVT